MKNDQEISNWQNRSVYRQPIVDSMYVDNLLIR